VPVFRAAFARLVHRAYADFVDGYTDAPSPSDEAAPFLRQYPNLSVRS
jgi:hypothetical protein